MKDRPKPDQGHGAVLIRTEADGVGGVNLFLYGAQIPGAAPAEVAILGGEVADIVTAVGRQVAVFVMQVTRRRQ